MPATNYTKAQKFSTMRSAHECVYSRYSNTHKLVRDELEMEGRWDSQKRANTRAQHSDDKLLFLASISHSQSSSTLHTPLDGIWSMWKVKVSFRWAQYSTLLWALTAVPKSWGFADVSRRNELFNYFALLPWCLSHTSLLIRVISFFSSSSIREMR